MPDIPENNPEESISNLVNNLNNLNKSVSDSIKAQQELAKTFGFVDREQENSGKGVRSLGGLFGFLGKASAHLQNTTEELASTNLLTGKKYNFFEQQRRLETLRSVKALFSFRNAILFTVGVIKGLFIKGIKESFGVLSKTGVTAARFGRNLDFVLNRQFTDELVKAGIKQDEVIHANEALIRQGFKPGSKATLDLVKRTSLLGLDIQAFAAAAKRLETFTGMSSNSTLDLVNTIIDFGAMYHMDSNRLISVIQELGPTLQRISLVGGERAAKATAETALKLSTILGTQFEERIADLIQGLNSSQFRSFVTQAMFMGGRANQAALAGQKGGLALEQELINLSKAVQEQFKAIGGGKGGPQAAIIAKIFGELTGISQNQLEVMLRIASKQGQIQTFSKEQVNALRERQAETVRQTDIFRRLNTVTQRLFFHIAKQMIPVIVAVQKIIARNADKLFDLLAAGFGLLKSLVMFAAKNWQILLALKALQILAVSSQFIARVGGSLMAPIMTTLAAKTAAGTAAKGGAALSGWAATRALVFRAGVWGLVAWGLWESFKLLKGAFKEDASKISESSKELTEALNKAYSDAGVAGFKGLVAAETAALDKELKKIEENTYKTSENTTQENGESIADVFKNAQILQSELTTRVIEELRFSNMQREAYYQERMAADLRKRGTPSGIR